MDWDFGVRISGAPIASRCFEIHSPYNGALLASIVRSEREQAEQALVNAYGLFRDRSAWLPETQRLAILESCIIGMTADADELAVGIASEGGKPLKDARIEVGRAIDGLRLCCDTLRTRGGQVVPMRIGTGSEQRLAFSQFEPLGVVVAVSAFNHPLNLIVHQVAPAVAAGCPVIIKPSDATPLSCLRFVNLLRNAGCPETWCQVLTTENEVTERIVCDSRTGFFSFIGSSKVGWMLRSKLAPGTRCALEHGGAAPVIVLPDADLDLAATAIAKGGFYHAGQVCVSVQRVFVHQSVAAEFSRTLIATTRTLKVGDPLDSQTDVGPLINPRERDRVHAWVQEAVGLGAELLAGGRMLDHNCYEPTLLRNPPAEAKISCEEIFGPVIALYEFDELSAALAQANSLPYAFQAAVFTRDIDKALAVASGLDASAVMINDHSAFRVDGMPFAGLKRSGVGVGGIPYTLHDMCVEKLFVVRSPGL